MVVRKNSTLEEFPGGEVDKNLPTNAGDTGLIPGPGRVHLPQSNWAHESQLLAYEQNSWSLRGLWPLSHN